MRFRDIRTAEKAKRDAEPKVEASPVDIPMVRKQRRALIASERRRLCLGRDGGHGNWIPRPRAVSVAKRRQKAKAEEQRRLKSKLEFFKKAIAEDRVKIPTLSRERNDDACETADAIGHSLPEGQLAEEL